MKNRGYVKNGKSKQGKGRQGGRRGKQLLISKKAKAKRAKKPLFNITNSVTFLRLVLLPFILFFIAIGWSIPALAVFIFASLLDRMDGYLANRLKQATEFGKGFDAAVDSTTIFLVFVFLAVFNYIPWLYFAVIVFFGLVTFLMQAYFLKKTKKVLHTWLARIATLFTYLFIMSALLKSHIAGFYVGFYADFYIDLFFGIAAVLSFVRCAQYAFMVFLKQKNI